MRRRLIALALVAVGSAVAAGCDMAPIQTLVPCVETHYESDESLCSYIPVPGASDTVAAVDVSGL